jgi:long-chain acyl-CoA synthetase
MDRGYHVLVFPEGHRSSDGVLMSFRSGIGVLARESMAPVLPMALVGLGELKVRGRGWFRSGKIEVRVGEAMPPPGQTAPEEVAEQLRDAVLRLLENSATQNMSGNIQ